jgi:hypothetical protein
VFGSLFGDVESWRCLDCGGWLSYVVMEHEGMQLRRAVFTFEGFFSVGLGVWWANVF